MIQNICTPPGRILFNHMAPMAKHLTHRIEMVQRSAARYVQNDYHYTSSVTNMLRELFSGILSSNAEIKPVSQCYTKYITNRLMSITVI